jgi:hypothetical protein
MRPFAILGLAAATFSGAAAAAQTPPEPPPQADSKSTSQQDDFSKALDQEIAKSSKGEAATGTPTLNLPGNAQLSLLDISLDVLSSVGTSTEQNDSLSTLQLGDHDPNRRGFRLNQAELSGTGAVDPYFNGEAHIVYSIDSESGETGVELEEAFFTTQSLPYDLQLKGGQYFTEFGRLNSIHPHAWDFEDQPVILGRIFGGDGMRGPGARLSWLAPTPWFSELYFGVQNADGEQMTSFLANSDATLPGGHVPDPDRTERSLADYAYTGRILESWDLRDDVVTQFGLSGAWGPNAAGSGTRTSVYGADLKVKWQPPRNDDGWPFVIWQSEVLRRNYGTDTQFVDPDGIPASGDEFTAPGGTMYDTGLYSYLLWGFERDWITGLRYEYATASGPSAIPRDTDPLRDDRTRLSGLLIWQPTHFSRVSLQYNYDIAEHLAQHDAHSVWLRIEFLWGKHPAHKY